jgi:hypothetical protein
MLRPVWKRISGTEEIFYIKYLEIIYQKLASLTYSQLPINFPLLSEPYFPSHAYFYYLNKSHLTLHELFEKDTRQIRPKEVKPLCQHNKPQPKSPQKEQTNLEQYR